MMLHCASLVRADILEKRIASIIRVTRIGKLGMLAEILCQTSVCVKKTKEEYSVFLHSVLRLLVTANVPSSPILVTQIMKAIRSSETSVLTKATGHNIPVTFNIYTVHTTNQMTQRTLLS
jgi:hypothetical protein